MCHPSMDRHRCAPAAAPLTRSSSNPFPDPPQEVTACGRDTRALGRANCHHLPAQPSRAFDHLDVDVGAKLGDRATQALSLGPGLFVLADADGVRELGDPFDKPLPQPRDLALAMFEPSQKRERIKFRGGEIGLKRR
jgi:hypothetical protein